MDGFQVRPLMVRLDSDWKAAYGIMLIEAVREADHLTELTGKWHDAIYPTEEEFLEMRKRSKYNFNRGSGSGKGLLRINSWEIVRGKR